MSVYDIYKFIYLLMYVCIYINFKVINILLLFISGQGPYVYIKINFINFNKFYY